MENLPRRMTRLTRIPIITGSFGLLGLIAAVELFANWPKVAEFAADRVGPLYLLPRTAAFGWLAILAAVVLMAFGVHQAGLALKKAEHNRANEQLEHQRQMTSLLEMAEQKRANEQLEHHRRVADLLARATKLPALLVAKAGINSKLLSAEDFLAAAEMMLGEARRALRRAERAPDELFQAPVLFDRLCQIERQHELLRRVPDFTDPPPEFDGPPTHVPLSYNRQPALIAEMTEFANAYDGWLDRVRRHTASIREESRRLDLVIDTEIARIAVGQATPLEQ